MFGRLGLLLIAGASGAVLESRKVQLRSAQDPDLEAKLDANLAAQASTQEEEKRVAQTDDIDAHEKIVANETGSAALAEMLGSMYKDMRLFGHPLHMRTLQARQDKLKHDEAALRAGLAASSKAEASAEDAKKVDKEASTDADDDADVKDDSKDDDSEDGEGSEKAVASEKTDYNDETELHEVAPGIWPAESGFPVTVEYSIAIIWVLFVASVPFALARVTAKEQTNIDLILSGLLLFVLFGGLYLFTNIILFQSAHFGTIRPLTLVECVYMMSQVITTVGYGDVTPAKQRGQVFVGFYVITSFLVIAVMMSNLVAHLIRAAKVRFHGEEKGSPRKDRDDNPAVAWMRTKDTVSYTNLGFNFLVYLFFAATWSIFFATMPGEGKKWYEAVYMSIITLSTVGFGAFTATTEAGKVFAAFWMIFGSLALVGVIGEFTNVMGKERENEDYTPQCNREAVDGFESETAKTTMTEAEFIQFYMVNRKLTSQEEVEAYRGAFRTLSHTDRNLRGRTVSAAGVADVVESSGSFQALKGRRR